MVTNVISLKIKAGSPKSLLGHSASAVCKRVSCANLSGHDSHYCLSQPLTPFQEDPSEFEGLWQVGWSRSPILGWLPYLLWKERSSDPFPLQLSGSSGGIYLSLPVMLPVLLLWLGSSCVPEAYWRTWHKH